MEITPGKHAPSSSTKNMLGGLDWAATGEGAL